MMVTWYGTRSTLLHKVCQLEKRKEGRKALGTARLYVDNSVERWRTKTDRVSDVGE